MVEFTKKCTDCGEAKPFSEFYKHKGRKDGRHTVCKPCHKARAATFRAQYPEKVKESKRKSDLKNLYGISPEEYDDMLAKQQGGCAMCGKKCKSGKSLSVDHCHATGKIRGLLCAKCNMSLGCLNDDPGLMRRGADYLEANGP